MKIFFTVIFNNIFIAYLLIVFKRECLWPFINIIELFLLISQSKTNPIEINSEIQSYAE